MAESAGMKKRGVQVKKIQIMETQKGSFPAKKIEDDPTVADKQKIDDAVAALKRALEGDNVEEIKAKTEELKQASYKIAEEVYKQQQAAGAGSDMGGAGSDAGAAGGAGGGAGPNKGTAEDVSYEVVDDDK